jgi:SAM-dependent methyltransferase
MLAQPRTHHPAAAAAENSPAGNIPETELVEICPLCESRESRFLFWNTDRHHRLPGKFGLESCANCGLRRLSPRPLISEIGSYYPENAYYSFQAPAALQDRGKLNEIRCAIRETVLLDLGYLAASQNQVPKLLRPIVARLFYTSGTYGYRKKFPKFVPDGKALDIGCGSAQFLSLLKTHGWQVSGVDPSETAAQTAKDLFDIDVFTGNVEDAPFDDASFDYIRLNHSIEHVPNPIETLRAAARLLKPGGEIYIETPNAEAYGLKKMGTYWMPLETPRHLHLFTPASLRSALEKTGFQVTRLNTSVQNFYLWVRTYRTEDERGSLLSQRPLKRFSDVPGEMLYRLKARLKHFFDRNSGDFLHCWAKRGGGNDT